MLCHETRVIRAGEAQWITAAHRDGAASEVCVNVTDDDEMVVALHPADGHRIRIEDDR